MVSIFQAPFSTPSFIPTVTSAPQRNDEWNTFLLERQRQLEQQIIELQRQAREQQDQILRQLKLLEVQTQRNFNSNFHSQKASNFHNHKEGDFNSQNKLNFNNQKNFNSLQFASAPLSTTTTKPDIESINFTVRPREDFNFAPQIAHNSQPTQKPDIDNINLTIRPSIEQYSFSLQQQQHPIKEPGHFQLFPTFFNNLVNPNQQQQQQHQQTSIQIQSSVQQSQPLEAASFQQLPQRGHQEFNTVPLNAFQIPLSSNQQLPETQLQQRNRGRHFRQESNIGNFGVNPNPSFGAQNFFQQFLPTQERPRDFHQPQQFQSSFFQSGNLNNNLITNEIKDEFKIISKILALNHGI